MEGAGAEWWHALRPMASTATLMTPRAELCSIARLLRIELLMCRGIIAPAVLEVRGLSSDDKSLRRGDLAHGDQLSIRAWTVPSVAMPPQQRARRAHLESCPVNPVERNESHRVVDSRDTRCTFCVMWLRIAASRAYIADVAPVPHDAGLVAKPLLRKPR
jgi:hypothetical protein